LEALLLAGDEAAVARLLRDEPSGLAEARRRYLMIEASRRDRELVLQLRDLYDGACQICGWAPRASYGADICEAHHVRWLSRGGEDGLANLVLLCPNHHRAVHHCDAPYDFDRSGFLFGETIELLADRRHTLAPYAPVEPRV
jgi:5-methylcytosine-specific restriction protein A